MMIEVLATLAVVLIGLWGLLDLQTRLQVSEMESYQRTQALLLLDDMANRLLANRAAAASYATDPVRGVGAEGCDHPDDSANLATRDKSQWCLALQGAAEQYAESRVGTLLAGRGCVEASDAGAAGEYLVTVVWQGSRPIAPPPAGISCGRAFYNLPEGSGCARNGDACRRYVSTVVKIADLRAL